MALCANSGSRIGRVLATGLLTVYCIPHVYTTPAAVSQRRIQEQGAVAVDQTLRCRECGVDFIWTEGEQEFFASRGLTNPPSRCPSCRAARRAAAGGSGGGGGYGGGGGGGGGYNRVGGGQGPDVEGSCA